MHKHEDQQDTLLIVDDTPENISVLFEFLIAHDFKVLVAENGESALINAVLEHPALILLDVMMPGGIDGFETCRQLKENPQTRNIPVIFTTALSDTQDKLRGFKLGGVDYITRPFRHEEVLARINTHLSIRKLQNQLQAQNAQLVRLDEAKNELLGIVAHDLKSPLSSIQSAADFIKRSLHYLPREQVIEFLNMISITSIQSIQLIKNLLDVNAIESGKIKVLFGSFDILTILQGLVAQYIERAKAKNIRLQLQHLDKQYPAFVDDNRLHQVLENLISNAVKYSPHGKNIIIRLHQDEQHLRCEIQDEGPGLSDSDKQKLFGKFTRLAAKPTGKEHSTGLGLFIVKKLVKMMNGAVWCESELGQGATFIVEFPAMSRASESCTPDS